MSAMGICRVNICHAERVPHEGTRFVYAAFVHERKANMSERVFIHDLMEEIQQRWSPRAFAADKPVAPEDVEAILEAAHFAPSCMNEQPWRILVADDEPLHGQMLQVLSEKNRSWAQHAPVLLLLMTSTTFSESGKPNAWSRFDLGTAWGFLSLEAQRRGLQTHAMAGFQPELARTLFGLPKDLDPVAVVAVGYAGDKEALSPDLRERERPNGREPLSEVRYVPGQSAASP
jgi:nitroreductase